MWVPLGREQGFVFSALISTTMHEMNADILHIKQVFWTLPYTQVIKSRSTQNSAEIIISLIDVGAFQLKYELTTANATRQSLTRVKSISVTELLGVDT